MSEKEELDSLTWFDLESFLDDHLGYDIVEVVGEEDLILREPWQRASSGNNIQPLKRRDEGYEDSVDEIIRKWALRW